MPEKHNGVISHSREEFPLESSALDEEWGTPSLEPAGLRRADTKLQRRKQGRGERRGAPRFGLRLPIQAWLDAAPEWHYDAHTVNISSRGVLFSFDSEDPGNFKPAAALSFDIALEGDAETKVILQGKGRVVRTENCGESARNARANTRIAAIFKTRRIVRL